MLRIPAELRTAIFTELGTSNELWTLAQLCLVCKELRDVAQPILFSSFATPECGGSLCKAVHRTKLFTAAILSRPSLRLAVRSIQMDCPVEHPLNSAISEERDGWHREILLAAVEKVPFDDGNGRVAGLENLSQGLLTSLLVAITPHLLTLDTWVSDEDTKHMVTWVQADDRAPKMWWIKPFTQLKVLNLGFRNTHMADIIPLLQLPTLRTFVGAYCIGTYSASRRRNVHTIRRGSIQVEDLKLHSTHMDLEFLQHLLAGCKNLLRLEYELMDEVSVIDLLEDDQSRQFSVRQLVEALKAHVSSLEELKLAFLLCEEVHAWEGNPLHGIETLKHLRKLSADLKTLADLTTIPPRLEEVEIRRCSTGWFLESGAVNLFMALVKEKSTGMSELQRVNVVVDEPSDLYGFFELMSQLDEPELVLAAVYQQRERFKQAGLVLAFTIQDIDGKEDTEYNRLLRKDLDSTDLKVYGHYLSHSGKDWHRWE